MLDIIGNKRRLWRGIVGKRIELLGHTLHHKILLKLVMGKEDLRVGDIEEDLDYNTLDN